MFCLKCGTELPDDAAFCVKCGYKIGEAISGEKETNCDGKPQETSIEDTEIREDKIEKNPKKKKKGKKGLIIVLLLLLCIPAAIYGLYELNSSAKKDIEYMSENTIAETKNYSFRFIDARFVDSADFGTLEGNETATTPNERGETTLYLKFELENKGNETISLHTTPFEIIVDDEIVYDSSNTVMDFRCIETDDANGEIAPLSKKTYNYCVFNLPGALIKSTNISVKFELYGKTYIYHLYNDSLYV